MVRTVLARLAGRRSTLAVAESCTGGALGAAITAVPGASTGFVGGIIAYADGLKSDLLGVDAEILRVRGAVSEEVARAMARGARRAARADWALAVTGVAGPGGGSPGKPVGTVWLAVAGPGCDDAEARLLRADGGREAVRAAAVDGALRLLLARLEAAR
ncbi:MAG: CinA family protein [Gemmatimonadota bacterium]|nr:CinA family protein [Gemmatimonadota bacterium]